MGGLSTFRPQTTFCPQFVHDLYLSTIELWICPSFVHAYVHILSTFVRPQFAHKPPFVHHLFVDKSFVHNLPTNHFLSTNYLWTNLVSAHIAAVFICPLFVHLSIRVLIFSTICPRK